MSQRTTRDLRILCNEDLPQKEPGAELIGSLPEVLRAFRASTGWSLRYCPGATPSGDDRGAAWTTPVAAGDCATSGHLRLERPAASATDRQKAARRGRATAGEARRPAADAGQQQATRALAAAIGDMLTELVETRHALWQREAELAVGIPVAEHPQEAKQLAARLEAVLRAGAEAVGCHAAALYLLDDATSHLKLRSCWGLPRDRFSAPPRSLQGALADLEAMLGHAVVLDDAASVPQWNAPEDFPAAICLPVASPTSLLGTLWVFCNCPRDFNCRETNLLEVVAGRLVADLEREQLLGEVQKTARLRSDLAAAERLQRSQLPAVAPLLDGWEVAGWANQAGALGGAFFDWYSGPSGLLAFTCGRAGQAGTAAAISANTVRAAVRAHSQYHREAQETLQRANLTLWTGSAGDQQATVFHGLAETKTGRLCCAAAGPCLAIVVRAGRWQHVASSAPPLGESPESDYEQVGVELAPGDVLVLMAAADSDAAPPQRQVGQCAKFGRQIEKNLDLPANALLDLLRGRCLDAEASPGQFRTDRALLVLKRTAPLKS